MSWLFVREDYDGKEKRVFEVRVPQLLYLVLLEGSLTLLPNKSEDKDTSLLGIVHIGNWGIKLQAVDHPLRIIPETLRNDPAVGPPAEEYALKPKTDGETEAIFLRPNDRIFSPQTPGKLVLKWSTSHVQVNSSVTPTEIPMSEDPKTEGDGANPEDETEDEEDLDNTIMPGAATRSTPLPSASRIEVVQETPTVDRIVVMADPLKKKRSSVVKPLLTATTKPAEEITNGSAKKKSRHPTVKIPTKRSSPAVEEKEESTPGRSAKRAKPNSSDDHDEIVVQHPVRKTPAKGNKRVLEAPTASPPKSQRSSQHSLGDQEDYKGPPPRIAFSNSAIAPNSQALKFLKKNGGASVDSISDDCNILCVKDGTLIKTMKFLQSIALGIPVVSDKWLMDSAKGGHFLPLKPYIPTAPTQEKEWNFSLLNVWNQPQSSLFQGYTIHFTPSLKGTYKAFHEIEQVCKAAGARRVVSKRAGGKDVDSEDTIILVAEDDDPDAVALIEGGRDCFGKDFLTNSILRGKIDLESDEFKVKIGKPEKSKRKGRPKKS